jgi:acyl-coenzyme A synthetase/AMP-(fatty) acid ligase
MASLPLITHDRPEAIVAFRGGRPVTAGQFLREARSLARLLPAGRHMLNVCVDRYHFAIGLAAGLIQGKCAVLPSAQTPEMIRQLQRFAPDVFALSDDPHNTIELPQLLYPAAVDADARRPDIADERWEVPHIDAQRVAAYVFTSGSTGTPVPHRKRWGRLVSCVRVGAQRLPPLGHAACSLLGTVPPQHMYGFESTVLLPMQSGSALIAERPFFPADIAAVLEPLPTPRVLFSTPVHLRALLAADVELPALDLIVSATATLSASTAREVETRFATTLLEVYGSTETGQIATRRTATDSAWHLWPQVSLDARGTAASVRGGHVGASTPLADVIEPVDDEHFLLHGRTADLVNIAGKRTSIAYLNHQLNAIPGVLDGVFFVRDDIEDSLAGSGRLAALAVAPGVDTATIIRALRERIDPVFLPRPLLLVERLPRNETGKLPQQTLRALAARVAEQPPLLT